MAVRQLSPLDKVLLQAQAALSTLLGSDQMESARLNPMHTATDDAALSPSDKRHSAGLMRVNHTGEVCAQALYRGQACYASSDAVLDFLNHAVIEEQDHLVWCHARLNALSSHRSYLNVFWYTHSFFLGYLAGRFGDEWSLGFVEETEKQVGRHLDGHLERLSTSDHKSRAIIEQMAIDEAEHADHASALGAKTLPPPVKMLMRFQSKVMTTLAYWV